MTSAEIRQSFLDFFASKDHRIVDSASLLPTSPNLLFTNAGMNQFVPSFLGERDPVHSRIADTQKCIRAGGKHNDLEDVGFDAYHHTFFEMLGNWSFGDYFKKEAIEWAWELLTDVWKFPPERLYATVYQPGKGDPADFDAEAAAIWEGIFSKCGLDPKVHVRTGGKKDNFWMMGETGPCGPCSELHIDLTPAGDTHGELVNADSPWCIELWNLVFIQFNAQADGTFVPLKAQHVDTGMGFERIAGIIATTRNFTDFSQPPSNYNSDLFTDLFQHISNMSGHTYQGTLPENRDDMSGDQINDCIFRVLADHIRTLSFAIADGILPGNEGRNYVLRRILRRAVMYGKRLNLQPGFFGKLVDPLVDKMGPFFPELTERRDLISKVIANEEQSFDRTLDRGLQLLDRITLEQKETISGEEAFALYDTYGFPLDLTQLIARERGLKVDIEGFNREMDAQRKRARAARKTTAITVADDDAVEHSTQFVGYNRNDLADVEATIVGVSRNQDRLFILTSQTPFYAEMGGQVGDTGTLRVASQSLKVINTLRDELGHFLHEIDPKDHFPAGDDYVGQTAHLCVNTIRRQAIERHHSATHLLNWALREVLGSHVIQAGSLVTPDRLRFDFSHFEALTPEQLRAVEKLVNQRIIENSRVRWYEVPFNEKPENCMATFGEKYGAIVRVVDIGGYSVELCGGTHIEATGELGLFHLITDSAISAGTRRIEAITGETAELMAHAHASTLTTLARRLSCPTAELEQRLTALLEQKEGLERELRRFQQKSAAATGDELIARATEKSGLKWIATTVTAQNPGELRSLAQQVSKRLGPGITVLGSTIDSKVAVVAIASAEAIQAGHKAGEIIATLCKNLGGRGGGKPDFAMGGGGDPERLKSALQDVLA